MITIYHYTSIETLKLILKNQTLRFKSLGYVDDPNEQKTSDFGTIGSFNYVSCWTTQYDNIPQWNMYGDDCKGAMIAISFNTVLDVFETEKFSFDGESLVDILPLLNPLKTPVTPTNGYHSFQDEIRNKEDGPMGQLVTKKHDHGFKNRIYPI